MAALLPTEVCRAFAAIVLVRLPMGAVVPTFTITVMVQLPRVVVLGAMGIVPPDSEISVVPAVAVKVPPQVVEAEAIVKPVPMVVRLSENAVIVAAVVVSALVSVIVNVDVVPCAARFGEKTLVTSAPSITSVSVAAAVLLPNEVCNAPTGIVLVAVAIAALAPTKTGTVIVQLPFIGIEPPLSEIKVVATVAVNVPPQLVATVPPMVKPAPIVLRLSAKLVIAAAVVVFGLVSVMVSVGVDPRAAVVTLNDFATDTGVNAVTVRVAVAAT